MEGNNIYSTDRFTFDPKGKCFIAEASDLDRNLFKQIFPDSCDEGLELVSSRTGETSKWYVNNTQYSNDEDHELQAWHLIPTKESIQKYPRLQGYTMTIFND
jgi:hypothetical protein